jgi:hypothetical protein
MDNYDDTLEQLHLYRNVPLSVIFVGIGRSNFSYMYRLCQDHVGIPKNRHSSNDPHMFRPIITFVKFREHQHNILSLGDAALCNIPHQIDQYILSTQRKRYSLNLSAVPLR